MSDVIIGQEENEEHEAVMAGETGEAMEEHESMMAGDEIGFSFKKFRKKIGKNIGKLKKAAMVVAPIPTFTLLAAARLKGKKGLPFRKKIAAVKAVAEAPPEEIVTRVRDDQGMPVTLDKAEWMHSQAVEAMENLQAASEVQKQAFRDTGDFDAYDPVPFEYDPYSDYSEEEFVQGWGKPVPQPSLYEWGAMAGMEELVGFSLKKLGRKLGRTIDPTKKGSPFRSALMSVPGIGPQLTAAADMVANARAGDKSAKQKIEDVKALAANGDPKGKEALDNLRAAAFLGPKAKLAGLFSTYEYGARVST